MGGKTMLKNKKGFTLIELLIVVAIIAILAAIAIPQFSEYRIKGYNSAGHSDLKNIVTSEEAYFVDSQAYLDVSTVVTGPGAVSGSLPGAKLSNNVSAKIVADNTATLGNFYSAGTAHKQGNRIFGFESERGKFVYFAKVAGTTWTGAEITAATTNEDLAAWTTL